jgi:uncharacterized membrane protein YeiB
MELNRRLPGPDVVRALAMLGVIVMNFRGYLLTRGGTQGSGWIADLFDPWEGPLSTRFAATFVLVAGVGVTLMTNSAFGDRERIRELRWRLASRGLLLYVVGYGFDFIWPGTILPFYGAMFAIAGLLFTLRARWILIIGAAAAVAGAAVRWWRYERELDGADTAWLTNPGGRSVRGLVFDVFVNGTHPLLPWLAFFCAGIVLGRMLATAWWRPATIACGFTLYAGATIVNSAATSQRAVTLTSVDPFERGLCYTASALGTALVAYAVISWLADRYVESPVVSVLRDAGAMSLSLYVAHALVFNLVVSRLDWIEPAGLDVALLFALAFWVIGIAAAVVWHRRFGRGPVERLYRGLAT